MAFDIVIGRDKADKEKFEDKALIYLGKGYVSMGNYTSLSNLIWLDVARSHVILVAGKRGCLTGETNVFTDKGYKSIKEFNVKEDKILSFNKEKKDFEWETADLLKYNISKENLLEIELENGRKLRLTKEHPLLLCTGKKLLSLLWIKANELKNGNNVLAIGKDMDDLIPLKIKSIKEINGINEVYDLSVNKNHSFIANGIISHNSGKSYSLGVIAEELSDLPDEVKNNIAPLIFDTMGIFWTMKFKNEKEIRLLEEWQLKPKNLPINLWVPAGYFDEYEKRGIPANKKFALAVPELNIEDWLSIFNLEMTDPVSILIQRILSNLAEKDFDLNDIIDLIAKNIEADDKTKKAAISLFEAVKSWKVFASKDEKPTKISELIKAGKTSVLDLSMYSSTSTFNVRALIIGLVSKKLFNQRMLARKKEEVDSIQHGIGGSEKEREMPLVWLFVDECHEFLPQNEKTPASNALIQLLREGRQPGISMVLATQQPGVIHRDVMTQSDIIISHRLTNKKDLEALNEMMQTYLVEGITKSMNNLPDLKGSAIILDDNSERLYPVRIRPRFTWHGGEAPTSVKIKEKI
ncbi:MAG: DUF87 domain-containing protein [Nanoarchaeota archaeon]|nr:DUF87 domain-containing protein [Nanoarchaeota archaeon]